MQIKQNSQSLRVGYDLQDTQRVQGAKGSVYQRGFVYLPSACRLDNKRTKKHQLSKETAELFRAFKSGL